MEYVLGAILALLFVLIIVTPILNKTVKERLAQEKTQSYMEGFNDGSKLNTLSKIMRTHSIKK